MCEFQADCFFKFLLGKKRIRSPKLYIVIEIFTPHVPLYFWPRSNRHYFGNIKLKF